MGKPKSSDHIPCIFDYIESNITYKEYLIDELCSQIPSDSDFRDVIEYVLNNKVDFIKENIENIPLYGDDDNLHDFILPTIRRIWSQFFINPPSLLKDKRLELFQLYFNVDWVLNYLVDKINEARYRKPLQMFESMDRSSETCRLISDNYIANIFSKAYNELDVDKKIKELKRDKNINNLLNE
jgi:hypothetical protein